MTASKKKVEYNKRYNRENYTSIHLVLPKDLARTVENVAEKNNESKNGFIKTAIEQRLKRETTDKD